MEVLMGIVLIGTAAAIFGEVIPMSTKSQAMVANEQQALILIQHKIDQLRAIGYGRLTFTEMRDAGIIDASPTTSPFSFNTTEGLSSLYPSATGTITVSDFSTVVRQVTVTITWTGQARRQGNGSVSVSALIARV